MDGSSKISDTTIQDLQIQYNSPILLRFAVPKDTPNVGGCTLFGAGFGDYHQAIRVKAYYEEAVEAG